MNIPNPLSFPVLLSQKSWLYKKWNKASEELRIEMKVIRNKMKRQVKEVLARFHILLSAIRTKVAMRSIKPEVVSAIQAMLGFIPLLPHKWFTNMRLFGN